MEPDKGTTNIRNVKSQHWRRWLGPENRCLVPFTSFSEFNAGAGGDIWFAFDEDRPLAFFAGIWTNWTCVRKVKEGEVSCDLYGVPDHRAERRSRGNPSEGDAGHPDDGGRARCLAESAGGRGAGAAAAAAGWRAQHCGKGAERGCAG